MVDSSDGKRWLSADGKLYATAEAARQSFASWYQWEKPLPRPVRKLRVFVLYVDEDRQMIDTLYDRLKEEGLEPWPAKRNVVGGQDWREDIAKAIRTTDAVVLCLSQHALTKGGYLQREIRVAVEEAENQPEGAVFLIPVKLEELTPPQQLRRIHHIDYYEPEGWEELKKSLSFLRKWIREQSAEDI